MVLELSQFCTGVYDERTWGREAEESILLEAVARDRLLKTDWERLAGAAMISEL
jgi:hypothetical protein